MKKTEMDRHHTEWGQILLQFLFGAVPGLVVGVGIWAFWFDGESWRTGLFCIGGTAFFLGILAAAYGEDFWEIVKEYGHSLLPW